jgi:hypothetical protein
MFDVISQNALTVGQERIPVCCEFLVKSMPNVSYSLPSSDLKSFVKIVSGILVLRLRKCPDWTDDIDAQMVAWTQKYITWLETNKLGIDECASLKYVTHISPTRLRGPDNRGQQSWELLL